MKLQTTWAYVIGAILVIVGIIGFVYEPIFGIFPVNSAHNIIHLLTGAIFLWAAIRSNDASRGTNKTLGVIYLLVSILGFLGALTFLNVKSGSDPDNFLHVGIGLISVLVGWLSED